MYIELNQPNIECSKCNSINQFVDYTDIERSLLANVKQRVTYRTCKICNHKSEISRITTISNSNAITWLTTKPQEPPTTIKF